MGAPGVQTISKETMSAGKHLCRATSCPSGEKFVIHQSTQVEEFSDHRENSTTFNEDSNTLDHKESSWESYSKVCGEIEDLKNAVSDLICRAGIPTPSRIQNAASGLITLIQAKQHTQEIKSAIEKLENEIERGTAVNYNVLLHEGEFITVHGDFSQQIYRNKTDSLYSKKYSYKKQATEIHGDLLRLRVFPDATQHTQDIFPFSYAAEKTVEPMSQELVRLSSLSNFPPEIDVSLIRLAQSGFYLYGSGKTTKCYSCGTTYDKWKTGDDPWNVHKDLSPNCPLVRSKQTWPDAPGNNVRSEQRTSLSGNIQYSARAEIPRENTERTENVSMANFKENNVLPNTQRSSPVRDNTAATAEQLKNTRGRNDQSSTSTTSNQCQNSHDYSSLGINIEKPKYPNYASLPVRISSYQGWPSYLDQTPRQMALAGFLFAGYNDYTRCFYCGGGLRNWEAGDDPWVEHARWFPQCAFLKQNKGEKFINAVQKRQKEMENETNGASSSNQQQSAQSEAFSARQINNDQSQCLLQSVAAKSVLEMGYTNEQVLDAINEITAVQKDTGDLSATDIMRVLLGEDIQSTEAGAASSTTQNIEQLRLNDNSSSSYDDNESLIEENRQLRDQRLCKVCLDLDATIAFLPCGHIVCCIDCAPAMRKCPVCRTYVKGTVKTYLA